MRRHNPRQAKSLRCYSIAEAALLYGVHRNTIRNWLSTGLNPIDDKRPVLIRGDSLNRYHREARQSKRQVCGPAEIYCLGCRKPRRPAGDIADLIKKGSINMLIAICPDCDCVMTQRVNAERLRVFCGKITISPQLDSAPIEESTEPSLDCSLKDTSRTS